MEENNQTNKQTKKKKRKKKQKSLSIQHQLTTRMPVTTPTELFFICSTHILKHVSSDWTEKKKKESLVAMPTHPGSISSPANPRTPPTRASNRPPASIATLAGTAYLPHTHKQSPALQTTQRVGGF
jgi:hypothetical protein